MVGTINLWDVPFPADLGFSLRYITFELILARDLHGESFIFVSRRCCELVCLLAQRCC